MPRTTDITQKQITDICEKMMAADIKPTVDRVRAETGKGSRTTINRMIRDWVQNREDLFEVEISPKTEAAYKTLVQSVADTYESKIKELYALKQEQSKLTENYLNESEKHLLEAESERAENEKLKSENSDLLLKNNALLVSNSEVKGELSELKKEISKNNDKMMELNEKMMKMGMRAVAAETKLEVLNKEKDQPKK